MSDSFQKEKPPARINLFLEVQEGDATEKLELPMRLLVLGDYTDREDQTPVDERDVVNVNANNFESVMRSKDLSLAFDVENRLGAEEDDIRVDLAFEGLDDFTPERVARQVPELRRMVAMRNLLQDLRNRVVSTSEFRKELEQIVTDEGALKQLAEELQTMVQPDDAPAADPATDAAPDSAAPEDD
jgi:type VI secretion system protein ImpB